MLANYAKWYSFTPPQRPNFPPPLTGMDNDLNDADNLEEEEAIANEVTA